MGQRRDEDEASERSNSYGKLDRREALQALGAGGAAAIGAAALAGCRPVWEPAEGDPTARALSKPPVPGAGGWATHEERWIPTSCAQCPACCGIRVRVVEGRAVRIEGNTRNPLNQGGIGPRGLSGLQALYDPDRLTGPMLRRHGRLERASWDEALAAVIEPLRALRARGAPDGLLVMSGSERGFVHELFARFCRAYGTPHFIDGSPAHGGVLAQAMEACLGVYGAPAFDWGGAACVLSLEAALVEGSCQAVYVSRIAAERRRGRSGRRLKLLHAGPTLDLAAFDADEWLRIRPGSSGALALGLCHVLVGELGAAPGEAFGRFLETFAPERAAALCGVRAEQVVRLAHDLAELRPSFAYVDERSLAYTNGWETALATLALNALLGAIERPGGLRLPGAPPLAAWPEVVLDEIAVKALAAPRLDRAGTADFPRARSVHETLPEAIAAARPEIALLQQVNPAWARQQPRRWRDALATIPLVVSFSPFLDETVADVATIVLPDHTYLERWEDALPAPMNARPVVGVRRPVVEPLHDTRATGDVLLALAGGVGGAVAGAFPWRTFRHAMEARLAGLAAGSTESTGAAPRPFLDRLFEEGFWAGADPELRTIEPVLHAELAEPIWRGDPSHPLRLLAYRPLGYADGSGANQAWLHLLRDRPGARLWTTTAAFHPDSAPGVADGDRVEVRSAWGAIVAVARLDRRMEAGLVAVPMGGGHTAFGRHARGVGANVMDILAPDPAPRTGAAVLCGTRVALRRIGGGG